MKSLILMLSKNRFNNICKLQQTSNSTRGAQYLYNVLICFLIVISSCKEQLRDSDTPKRSSSYTDTRDGNIYKTVQIGNQVWMAENLRFDSENSLSYNENPQNDNKYGKYYSWEEAQKVCMKGWHLPSEKEWEQLITVAGGTNLASKTLLEGNSSGFNAQLSGYINRRKESHYLNTDAYYWTSTQDKQYKGAGRYFTIDSKRDKLQNYFLGKGYSFCLRCVQDELVENYKKKKSAYDLDEATKQLAQELLTSKGIPDVKFPNPHPDAQWFPKSLGLFMHWGIHSVKQLEPSWVMLKNSPWGINENYYGTQYHDSLATKFNPINYDPDKWMAAAKEAGFEYAVLTVKHHDGYALWPSKFGDMNTGVYLDGKDLFQLYVEACRKHGIKVGLYFSPRDWHYPNCPMKKWGYNYIDMHNQEFPYKTKKEGKEHWEKFYGYTIGQLNELLTNYGKIDLIWFDGQTNILTKDLRHKQTIAWIRELQPGIVINDRWYTGSDGDFRTMEGHFPGNKPEGWWEMCDHGSRTWGHCPDDPIGNIDHFVRDYKRTIEWGGSYLYNVGPAPDGTMPPQYYDFCKEIQGILKEKKRPIDYLNPENKRVIK